MKPAACLSVLAVLLICAIGLVLLLPSASPNAPRFGQARAPASLTGLTYDFLNPRPFEAGKMWIYGPSAGTNNKPMFIYDIENRRVLGEVTNCWPALLFGEPLQLLCYQPRPSPHRNGLKQRFLAFLEQVSRGRIKFPPAMNWQTYWLIDLKNNVAHRIGDIPIANSLMASPDFRYCFAFGLGQTGQEDYLLDLRERRTQKLRTPDFGWVYGWWDNTRLLLRTTNCDFVLYDVPRKAISPLITFESLATCFKNGKLEDDPKQTQSFAIWNGHENDFYLTDTHQKWLADESFLIKVERPSGSLRLVSPRFKFEWSDHLDRTGRYYLYTRRESGQGSDGVFLRDLEAGTDRVLVPPTTNKYFALPRFYGDSIIYVRSNALWQIGLDGSNNIKLFPPAHAEEARP